MVFLVYMVCVIQHSDLTVNSSISLVKKKKMYCVCKIVAQG